MNRPTMPSEAPVSGQSRVSGSPDSPGMNTTDRMQRLSALQAVLYGPEMTEEERRQHEQLVAERASQDAAALKTEAEFRDCLEFAKAHGLSGTPKFRRDAFLALRRAAAIIREGL